MKTRRGCKVLGTGYEADPETGEAMPLIYAAVTPGSIIYTPEEQEAYKKRKAAIAALQAQQEARRQWRKERGGFSFVSSDTGYQDLNPATVARLIYLTTFLDYEGVLKTTQRTPMKRGDLARILSISKSHTYRFWNEVKDRYICEDKEIDNRLVMKKNYFIRGKLPPGTSFQQIYNEAVRRLYEATPPMQHKYLGYVFQLIPYISLEYNIICTNPFEKDLEKVQPISTNGLCTLIGYSPANKSRLKDAYAKITFPAQGRLENLLAFVSTGSDHEQEKIFVNPHILYHGSRPEQVELLGKFCE